MYLNISGLTSNYVPLLHLAEVANPLIIFISETHIVDPDAFDQYQIPGFKIAFCLSHSRHTGGVAMYIRETIEFTTILNEQMDNNWFLGISIKKGMKTGNFGILYHSPNASDARFIQILDNWMENFVDQSKLNIIAGDFNINWKNDTDSNQLKRLVDFYNLKQTVKDCTRVTCNSRTLIDHVFSNFHTVVSTIDDNFKITDHETIFINLNQGESRLENKIKIKNWSRYSKPAISELVQRSLDFYTAADGLDDKAFALTDILKTCTNSLVQEKYITADSTNSWYSADLLRLKRKCDMWNVIFKRSNDINHWYKYKKLRNRYVKLLKRTRGQYIQDQIETHQHNSKELWKILKKMLNPAKIPSRSITFDSKECQSEQQIAENFNAYFVGSINSINKDIERVTEPQEIKQPFTQCRFDHFHHVTFAELKDICFSLKKTAGIDNVNAKVIQDCFHVIGHPLVDIVNQSLELGHVPRVWKESLVIPIQKIAGTIKAEEFRPINMLHTLEKILEIVIKNQLVAYLNANQLLIPEQSGYRESHSCETALNLVLAKWKENIHKKESIVAVFLDLKRAFETISRPLLLQCLKRFGINGVAFEWFKSYLSNRSQRTVFHDFISSSIGSSLGVPQGSVLGPILFIMYINDMKRVLQRCEINLFADDTVLFIANKDVDMAISQMNEDLKHLCRWLKFKELKLNISKTKYMVISGRKNTPDFVIRIDSEPIEQVCNIKYLGVTIDDGLTFSIHIDNVIKKIARKYGIMCRLKNDLTLSSKILLYKSIIAPHVDFCASILFLANATQLLKLQRLQNKIMRLILKCNRYTSSRLLLEALKWLSVKQRVIYLTMVFIFKILNGLLPQYLSNRIERGSSIHSHYTRNANDVRTPHFLNSASQNSLFYKGINLYNSMPRHIKQLDNLRDFKRESILYIKSKF